MRTNMNFSTFVERNRDKRTCKCGTDMKYSSLGFYKCPICEYEEKDLYGKMKELLEENPKMSKIELSIILNISIKTINRYIENGRLVNPKNF